MTTTEELQTRLSEAETALHKLLTGQKSVEVDYHGRRVKYAAAESGQLRAYIQELKIRLGTVKGRSRAIVTRF